MRRRSRALLCLTLFFLQLHTAAWATDTSARAAVLIDADSGRVLYAQNADEPMLIASITKIMTAVVALECCSPKQLCTVTAGDMAEGSSMYLQPGEQVTVEELLYGLMLSSGNDAALTLARCAGGSVEEFVAKMNDKAAELGMENTSFANPNGLDHEAHYSTARDMAVLTAYALENAAFQRIVSTKSITIGGRTMTNHNKLLRYCEGCIGVKTGYTRAAGRTLVSAARRNGQTLIAVTLNDGNDWQDHQMLLDYGFSAYPRTAVLSVGQRLCIANVKGGRGEVSLVAAGTVRWPLAAEETASIELQVPEQVTAPLPKGAVVGHAVVRCGEEEIGRVPLVTAETVGVSLHNRP